MDEHSIECWQAKNKVWLIAGEITSAIIALAFMLITISFLFAENKETTILMKGLAVFGTVTIGLIIVGGLNYLTDKIFRNIAIHKIHQKEKTEILKWVDEYSQYYEATEGRKPTEKELDQALNRWYQNKP